MGYRLVVSESATDLARFRARTRQGKQALDAGDGAVAAERFTAALEEWRDLPLSNVESELIRRDEVPALEEQRLGLRVVGRRDAVDR